MVQDLQYVKRMCYLGVAEDNLISVDSWLLGPLIPFVWRLSSFNSKMQFVWSVVFVLAQFFAFLQPYWSQHHPLLKTLVYFNKNPREKDDEELKDSCIHC